MALNNFMRIQTLMKISLMHVNKQSLKFCVTRNCENLCCASVMLLYKFHPVITNFVCRLPLMQVFLIYKYENIYYYYRYSALGPVWAETRAQSVDWYGSGTLHPGQVLRGSLPLLSPTFRRSHFRHQVPQRRERS